MEETKQQVHRVLSAYILKTKTEERHGFEVFIFNNFMHS